jgi:hypothetical protein
MPVMAVNNENQHEQAGDYRSRLRWSAGRKMEAVLRLLRGDKASPPDYGPAVEYLRDLEAGLRYWYQAAEIKAQVAVAINGALAAILGGSLLGNRDDVARTIAVFGPETWVFLAGMTLAIALSIYCAVACLVARSLQQQRVQEAFIRHGVEPSQGATYHPEVTAFFLHLAALQHEPFRDRMLEVDQRFVLEALASSPVHFSKNVLRKHQWVNRAFVSTGVGLGFFLCLGVSYLVRVVVAR